MRLVPILLLGLLGCGAGAADPRTEEIWVIDLESYSPEVQYHLDMAGIEQAELEPRLLVQLEAIFDGIPVRFRFGSAIGSPTESSICVREGETGRIGRGLLDIGNTSADHDCGEPDGTEHGAFINHIVEIFLAQSDFADAPSVRTDQLARILAVVLAHEIGHGLGLEHATLDYGRGDVMKVVPFFDVDGSFYFNEPDRDLLAANVK